MIDGMIFHYWRPNSHRRAAKMGSSAELSEATKRIVDDGRYLQIRCISLRNSILEEIHFVREKTKNSKKEKEKKIVIILTDELKAIIEKWGNKNKGPNE